MFKLVKKQTISPISLKEHFERRNRVLIKRRVGGYGDILMQRMIWEDFSKELPELEFNYTCPAQYYDFANNHPFIKTIKIEEVEERNFGIIYDITTPCRVHESRYGASNKDNRSDIWARHCGIELKNHNMHMHLDEYILQISHNGIKNINPENLPTVLFTPQSTTCEFGQAKSLMPHQMKEVVEKLRNMGFFVFSIHNNNIEVFDEMNVPQILNIHPSMWMALTKISDYVISVDTSTFHLAGGLGKKLVGIFTFTDGEVYGKYYDFILVQKHRSNGDWDCGPCFSNHTCPKSSDINKPCLTELTSDDIIAGFTKLLNNENQKIQPPIQIRHRLL